MGFVTKLKFGLNLMRRSDALINSYLHYHFANGETVRGNQFSVILL
jgi:hypothetical protein